MQQQAVGSCSAADDLELDNPGGVPLHLSSVAVSLDQAICLTQNALALCRNKLTATAPGSLRLGQWSEMDDSDGRPMTLEGLMLEAAGLQQELNAWRIEFENSAPLTCLSLARLVI